MKLGKLVFALAALLILGGSAMAQIEANRLCLHNGSDYYSNAGWMPHTSINDGAGKYFPSFAHWASTEDPEGNYSWKIRGYAWAGMQGPASYGSDWTWGKCLQASVDNPYATTMTFDYPYLYCTEEVPHTGHPWIVYGGTFRYMPSNTPFYYRDWSFPTTYGPFDSVYNVFEYYATTWSVSSAYPWYGWVFSTVSENPSGAAYVGSQISIYQYTFEQFGNHGQYQLLSGNEMDCTQAEGGQKGKNYYLGSIGDTNWFFYSPNECTGGQSEWVMCLFLEDAVTFPVNRQGTTFGSNPYDPDVYGTFDAGVATLMPNVQSTGWSMQIAYEDYDSAGDQYIVIGSIPSLPPQPFTKFHPGTRLPGRFSGDPFAKLFYQLNFLFKTKIDSGFTACMFGTTTGGLSPFPVPFFDPIAKCLEIRMWGFNVNEFFPGAGFMITMF
jgi:hypothetical protein